VPAEAEREPDGEAGGEVVGVAPVQPAIGPQPSDAGGLPEILEYASPGWAAKFLDQWCVRTMRSKIEPMKKIVKSLREHRDLILNWFRAKGTVSSGSVEGLNNKAKLTIRKPMVFAPTKPLKSPYITHLATSPSQTSPTNSVDEANKKERRPKHRSRDPTKGTNEQCPADAPSRGGRPSTASLVQEPEHGSGSSFLWKQKPDAHARHFRLFSLSYSYAITFL